MSFNILFTSLNLRGEIEETYLIHIMHFIRPRNRKVLCKLATAVFVHFCIDNISIYFLFSGRQSIGAALLDPSGKSFLIGSDSISIIYSPGLIWPRTVAAWESVFHSQLDLDHNMEKQCRKIRFKFQIIIQIGIETFRVRNRTRDEQYQYIVKVPSTHVIDTI